MSSLGPPYGMATTYPAGNFDQGLGRAKKAVDFNRENYLLGALATVQLFSVNAIASQANTTVQAYFVLPGRVKIPKLAVFCSALTAQALSAASFNIVLGTGAYSQGSIPGNDNVDVPTVSYGPTGQPTAINASGSTVAGGGGLASNPAVAGNAMFAADVVFNTTNFPNLTTATGTGATYAQILVPSSPDAVWPNSGVLTLRYTTAASATITNLIITAFMEPQPLSASFPASNFPPYATPEPGIDF